MREVARELGVVVPVSFFERAGQAYYNSIAIVDADGAVLGVYRKSHIPDGPGYEEKFYFRPGDTGFRVWQTKHGTVGVGICWDQWFPESARAMMLIGRGGPLLSDGHRQRAARAGPRHARSLAAGDDRPRGVERRPRRGREPHRRPRRAALLRVVVHRRPPGRQGGGARPGRRGGDRRAVRPRRAGAHAGLVGLFPRPPAGALRRPDDGGWASRGTRPQSRRPALRCERCLRT